MPLPSSALRGRDETILASIRAATECFLHVVQRQSDALARGDFKEADQLNPEIQIILDDRGYLIREFAKLHSQAS